MNKLVLAAAAVLVAATSFSAPALADRRGQEEWLRGGRHMEQSERGFRERESGNRYTERRHRGDDEWRRDRRHRHHHHHHWRHWRGGYWGPSVVISPGYFTPYCFIKKVRRYDQWGNLYIKRVRVCH